MDEPEIHVLRTALTRGQVVKALESSMDHSELSFLVRIREDGNRPIIGNVYGNQCQLMRRPFFNDYAGIFEANIFEEENGTRLDGKFVRVRFGLWANNNNGSPISLIKIWIGALILFQAYNAIGSFMEKERPLINPPSMITGILLILLCLWLPVTIGFQRRQKKFIVDHVTTVLQATKTS